MTNITRPGVTDKSQDYKGFIVSWDEPPMYADAWRANVATNEPHLLRFMSGGSKVIEGRNRDDMIAAAKKYIDGLPG
jgi:hypothetical protein